MLHLEVKRFAEVNAVRIVFYFLFRESESGRAGWRKLET